MEHDGADNSYWRRDGLEEREWARLKWERAQLLREARAGPRQRMGGALKDLRAQPVYQGVPGERMGGTSADSALCSHQPGGAVLRGLRAQPSEGLRRPS